jgi:hypothetical protein
MRDGTAWQGIFLHVLDVDAEATRTDEVSAELLGLAARDRCAVEAARVHVMGLLSDCPDDHRNLLGLSYLDAALRRGDQAAIWKPTSPLFDPGR